MKNRVNIAILGSGESGTGTAVLAHKLGMHVFVSDKGSIKEKYKIELDSLGVEWEENYHSEARIFSADMVVKSPGIPDKAPIIQSLKDKGIPVISEIEFAYPHTNAKLICITGSNGKTTTTLMTYHTLTKAGLNVGLAGNIGSSFARQVALCNYDYYVLELSSFQLDGMFEFKADIAILTNITPDHLDRYEYDMQKYADSKFRIVQNQTSTDYFIYNDDDEWIAKGISSRNIPSIKLPFSHEHQVEQGAFTLNEQLTININKQQTIMSIHKLAQQGRHSAYNSMASGIASRVLEIRKEIIKESFSDFKGIEHRIEFVASVHGIEFINDSKATNVNSTWFALESMEKPVIWIAGGVDKGNDYEFLSGVVKQKVIGIICLGKDNEKIHQAFGGIVNQIWDAGSAEEAVALSYRMAKKGQVVLLSPACASFDLFENYEDRGNQFKRAVKSL